MNRFLLALAIRILIAVCTRTYFQPDEYYQSLEPAHHAVFGYGHLTWEWLAPRSIRSIVYPAVNIPVFWALKATGMDQGRVGDVLLIIGPRILHGGLAALTDLWVCELTKRTIGDRYVSTVYFVSLTSFFHSLSLSRSLSNSLETSLTTAALASFPWSFITTNRWVAWNSFDFAVTLGFAVLACAVRPTNAILWVYMILVLYWRLRGRGETLLFVIFSTALAGISSLVLLFIVDSVYFDKPTFIPYNFLITNMSSVSLFYGVNPWHYYLTQAIPILCTTSLPFVLHGIWTTFTSRTNSPVKYLIGLSTWTVAVYSLAGHKEWRFLHPILPVLHIIAAKSLVELSPRSVTEAKLTTNLSGFLPPIRRAYIMLLSATIPASLYVLLFYCSGPISVMGYLRSLPAEDLQSGGVGFLMPCHSTPGYAYLHREELAKGKLWALGCEPPQGNQNLRRYRDQTDVFYTSPHRYLTQCFPRSVNSSFPMSPFPASIPGARLPAASAQEDYLWVHEWPKYLVLFGALLDEHGVRDVLEEKGYVEVKRMGRWWEGDDKRRGGVRVWKWFDNSVGI